MNVLNSLIKFATSENLLQPFEVQQIRHRVSYYADNAVIFLRASSSDLLVMKQVLDLSVKASGLHTKFS